MSSLKLASRCSLLLSSVGGICTWEDFDEELSSVYDPNKDILIVTNENDRKEEEAAAQGQETQGRADEQSDAFHEERGGRFHASPQDLLDKARYIGWLGKGAVGGLLTGTLARLAGHAENIWVP